MGNNMLEVAQKLCEVLKLPSGKLSSPPDMQYVVPLNDAIKDLIKYFGLDAHWQYKGNP